MGFILPALASAFANKLLGGGGQQQPQQQLDFTFQHRPRMVNSMPFLRGIDPSGIQPLEQDPILAAMLNAGNDDEDRPQENRQSFLGRTGDEFMSELTKGLVQRLIFGGGQQAPSYSPPRFR